MTVRIDEIAPDTFRLSTFVPEVGPSGFTFNQFLVRDEQPLLFHTGHRHLFPDVAEAIGTLVPIEQLRWITFGHVEADECGAMNELLAAAPDAQVAHGALGCAVSLDDMADRRPVPLAGDQVIELGEHRVRHIDTPHVPHGWEARVLFDETTNVLFCGDLFTQLGDGPALTEEDVLAASTEAEDVFGATCLTPSTAPTIRSLADLQPTTLATMHGPSFAGDGAAALHALADLYAQRLAAAS
jgi:flavorubredoxin